jgi:hypothetical protein
MAYRDETPVVVKGKVGRQNLNDGAVAPIRLNMDGNVVLGLSGKYADACLAGRVFGVANQAGVAVTAAFAATWTGLAVGNPSDSGVNCSLINMSFSNSVVSDADGTVGIMGGVSNLVPIVAALNIQNQKLDGPASKCTASGAQTINAAPAPTLIRVTGITGTGAVTTWRTGTTSCDLDGGIVVPPGYYWAAYFFMLSSAGPQFSFAWEETPI